MVYICFTGAVQILRNIDDIDFAILYSGKMSLNELKRIHRLARTDCVYLPHFLKDMSEYRKVLHKMLKLNKLENCKVPKQIKYNNRKKTKRQGKHKTKNSTDNKFSLKMSEKFVNYKRTPKQVAAGLSRSVPTMKVHSSNNSSRKSNLPPLNKKFH